jgi:hypothetical protein
VAFLFLTQGEQMYEKKHNFGYINDPVTVRAPTHISQNVSAGGGANFVPPAHTPHFSNEKKNYLLLLISMFSRQCDVNYSAHFGFNYKLQLIFSFVIIYLN